MNNSREKFEAWLVQEIGEHAENNDKDMIKYLNRNVDIIYKGWQAATEQSQKEIAELEAKLNELVKFQSSADRLAKAQAESLNTIAELQAREKVLVEALRYVNKELIMYGYQYESKDSINVVLNEALATVRGE